MALPLKRDKIIETVRVWLASGRYAPGDRFPSDQELARKFRVTHVTVRGALRAFVDEGALERRIGWGTVVRDPATGPRLAADALVSAVGVAVPDSTYSFFNEVLRAIEAELHSTKRPLVLGHTWELAAREDTVVRGWAEQGLTRIIVASSGGCKALYQELLGRGVRVIFVDRQPAGLDAPAVTSRDEQGAFALTKHLLSAGSERVFHLAGPPGASTARARVEGFVAACQDAGLRNAKRQVVPAGFFMEDGYRATRALLAKCSEPPQAIFAANDPVAVGALRALAEDGLEVPGDVRVAGYGDTDLGRNFSLTTVRQFPERMGTEAVRLLLSTEPVGQKASVVIEPEVIVGKTSS